MTKNDKKITIVVETIEGEKVPIEVNIENKVSHLMELAMKKLSIEPGSATYEMLYDGTRLNLDSKIEIYNIPDNGIVLLQRVPKVG